MPPLPGEECLLTVFADIHYYFAPPCPKPIHHRFEKGSYLYIYHDVSQNGARIEIANNPGTPNQDAFCGGLHNVHVQHSTQFPTRSTVKVDGINNFNPHQPSQDEWHLPYLDPQNHQHSLLRLHTLDLYFWTLDDANQFLDIIGRVLTSNQLDTDRATTSAQPDKPISSVVQNLENVAISDLAYQNGQTPNSRSEPSVAAPVTQGTQQNMSFPPPPSGPPADQQASPANPPPTEEKKEPENLAPLPYNPAAPAAPEPIKHREKTPPPEDGTEGTGLLAAAAADQGIPYTPAHAGPNGAGMSFAPPPISPPANRHPYTSTPPGASTGYASLPPSVGLPRSATFPVQHHAQVPSPGLPPYQSPGLPPYQQYPGTPAWPGSPSSMNFAPPPQDINAHLYGNQGYATPQSSPHQMGHQYHSSTPSGYSNYTYEQSMASRQTGSMPADHEIHQQAYRPSEAEMNSNAQKYAQRAMKAPGQRPQKLEEKAARLESGVNRFLKKLEKKL